MLNSDHYNPDVLTCLANLSNDEVFTPPKLVNEILNMLPQELFKSSSTTFLDPVSKSGVFLREIAKRLIAGLEQEIPDLQQRLNHIFTKQLFGIAITELTALLSRRSVYCSKRANGKYSVCNIFDTEQGNIIYNRTKHTWVYGKCSYCGASQENYERSDELETHAYQLIHTDKPEEIFKMKFDVIIGNPPYQLSDGGFGTSASPIYHKFVEQAKKLNPTNLIMVIPDRWFAGGKGLNKFREEMLNDPQITRIIDYPNASECFPGVDVPGGICYFLWEKNKKSDCTIDVIENGVRSSSIRPLNEFDTLIRHGLAVNIIRKVLVKQEKRMNSIVSSRKPFGLATNIRPLDNGDIKLKWNRGEGPYLREKISVGTEFIDKWKVITSKTSYDHAGQPNKNGQRRVLSIIEILPPGVICTESYIIAGVFTTESEANILVSYLKTKFVRFLISQLSFSQDITRERFRYVPLLDFKEKWTDEKLYAKYGLTEEEKTFIESMIRPMDISKNGGKDD